MKQVKLGTQDWLDQAAAIVGQLAKQAAAAQWWDIAASLAQSVAAIDRLRKA